MPYWALTTRQLDRMVLLLYNNLVTVQCYLTNHPVVEQLSLVHDFKITIMNGIVHYLDKSLNKEIFKNSFFIGYKIHTDMHTKQSNGFLHHCMESPVAENSLCIVPP